MNKHCIEYTDTFGGEANYSWVRRATIEMPELTHYGYDGLLGYSRANRVYNRELMRRAKAAVGLTGIDGKREECGGIIEFRPHGSCTVLVIYDAEN